MRKLLIAAFVGLAFSACSDGKKQEKDILDEVLKVHDKVMKNDEALMNNKMKLDTLMKLPAKDTAEKTNMKALNLKLTAAEEAMETWMQKFQPDMTGKPHDEIISYYKEQKKRIMAVDSEMNAAIIESGKYLSNKTK